MDSLKIILALIAVTLLALGVLAAIGFLQYLLLFGIIGLAAVLAVRFWLKPGVPQIEASDPKLELEKVNRTLDEYKRKLK
jgi:hypothetical protein